MTTPRRLDDKRYPELISGLNTLLESARRASARAVNTLMTATYWEIGRRIVEFEQWGERRAEYGAELLERLSADLGKRFGRGFSRQNLQRFGEFYLRFRPEEIRSTLSSKSADVVRQTVSGKSDSLIRKSDTPLLTEAFPLPWSHDVLLIGKTRSPEAMAFLPRRGPTWRLVGETARSPDRLAILRAHGPLEEQGRHARPWLEAAVQ